MTRTQKIAAARQLREQGLSYLEIGGRLGCTSGCVQKWLKPEWARELERRSNAKRRVEKNAWTRQARKDPRRMKSCLRCGERTGSFMWASESPTACEKCIQAAVEVRWQQIEVWWADGLTFHQIRARLGWTHGHLAKEMHRMRAAGRYLPYRRDPEALEHIREGARRWQAGRRAA